MELLSRNPRRLRLSLLALTSLIVVSTNQLLAGNSGASQATLLSVKNAQNAKMALSSIMGRVVDPKNIPVPGAEVRAPGSSVVRTNRNGEFEIRGLTASERLPVSFTAHGFMDTTRIYKVGSPRRSTGNVIIIWPRTEATPLDAVRGGKLKFNGGSISLPPNALVDDRGRPLRNKVRVSLSVVDVSDRRQIRSVPGDFTARMRNKKIRQLETFGVFEVFVEGSEGRRANLAPGKTARVEFSIPSVRRRNAPRRVGLFSFDRNSGLWIEEGTLSRAPGRTSYIAFLANLITSWNADDPLNTTCIKLQILNDNNQPAPQGTMVEAEGVDYSGLSPIAYSDSNGYVCLSVKRCATVRVKAFDPANPAINSCPVRISTPCHSANSNDCGNPSLCPLQPDLINLPDGTLYHDLNADDPANWHRANGWTNYDQSQPATSPYDVWWLAANVVFSGDGIMRLRLDNTPPPSGNNVTYTSGEYRSNTTYGYGTFEACLKPAKGSGLMTSFFTYTGPNETPATQHDEIDIEFRGVDTTNMWTNFFYNGIDTGHEGPIALGFDAADEFHRYKFVWTASEIKWYVDGVLKRTVTHSTTDPLPITNGKIMVNLWSGRSNANSWLGPFTYPSTPIDAEYDWIRYKP